MSDKPRISCVSSPFCCKDSCLQKCENIKNEMDSLKERVNFKNASRSLYDEFTIKYNAIISSLKEIEDVFANKENSFDCKVDIIEKLDKRKEIIKENRTNHLLIGVIIIVVLILVQFFLVDKRDTCFGNNMLGTLLIYSTFVAIFIVIITLIIEMVLFYYKNNIIINKLEMLILKVEMSSDYNYKVAERELQLITRLWDNKSILDVFIKH